jgi:hypothetical protein
MRLELINALEGKETPMKRVLFAVAAMCLLMTAVIGCRAEGEIDTQTGVGLLQ